MRASRRWLADHLSSAAGYLGSVFVAVLSVPVLPDIAVEALGNTRRYRLRTGYRPGGLGPTNFLVLPLLPGRSSFRGLHRRTGEQSVPEVLVDATRPTTVLGTTSLEVPQAEVAALRSELDGTGVDLCRCHERHEDDDSGDDAGRCRLRAECAYVSTRFDGANRLLNTQRAHGFSPQLTGGAGS